MIWQVFYVFILQILPVAKASFNGAFFRFNFLSGEKSGLT